MMLNEEILIIFLSYWKYSSTNYILNIDKLKNICRWCFLIWKQQQTQLIMHFIENETNKDILQGQHLTQQQLKKELYKTNWSPYADTKYSSSHIKALFGENVVSSSGYIRV